jgi:hypothetical protein
MFEIEFLSISRGPGPIFPDRRLGARRGAATAHRDLVIVTQ